MAVALAALALAGPAAASVMPCLAVEQVGVGATASAIVYQDTWSRPKTCKPGYCGIGLNVLNASKWRLNRPSTGLPLCSASVVRDVGPSPFRDV